MVAQVRSSPIEDVKDENKNEERERSYGSLQLFILEIHGSRYHWYQWYLLQRGDYDDSCSSTSRLRSNQRSKENCSSSTQKMNVFASVMEKLLATKAFRGLYGR